MIVRKFAFRAASALVTVFALNAQAKQPPECIWVNPAGQTVISHGNCKQNDGDIQAANFQIAVIPEPSTIALMLIGIAGAAAGRRFKSRWGERMSRGN